MRGIYCVTEQLLASSRITLLRGVSEWVSHSMIHWESGENERNEGAEILKNHTPPFFDLLWSVGLLHHLKFPFLSDILITNPSRGNFSLKLFSFDVYYPSPPPLPYVCERNFSQILYKHNVLRLRTLYKYLKKIEHWKPSLSICCTMFQNW
jgi:hypothetical protein